VPDARVLSILTAPSPVLADCVEKVLCGGGINFLRATGPLSALGRGGPLRRERIPSVAFSPALRGHRRRKSAISSLSRKSRCGGIFDFFNTIGPWQAFLLHRPMSAFEGNADIVRRAHWIFEYTPWFIKMRACAICPHGFFCSAMIFSRCALAHSSSILK